MTENDRVQCKLLAFLLEYPASSWDADLADVHEVVETVADQTAAGTVAEFFELC